MSRVICFIVRADDFTEDLAGSLCKTPTIFLFIFSILLQMKIYYKNRINEINIIIISIISYCTTITQNSAK